MSLHCRFNPGLAVRGETWRFSGPGISNEEGCELAIFSSSAFTILALGACIFIMRRAAGRENAPGLSARFRLILGTFFVCVAFSTAAGLSALIAAAQVLVMGYLAEEGALLPAVSPRAMASSYLVGSMATVSAFHRVMYWYFGYLSGLPG